MLVAKMFKAKDRTQEAKATSYTRFQNGRKTKFVALPPKLAELNAHSALNIGAFEKFAKDRHGNPPTSIDHGRQSDAKQRRTIDGQSRRHR
jgi:hypothetical protein